jgi:RNA polymerase sigma-70 factor, ECF subfamily
VTPAAGAVLAEATQHSRRRIVAQLVRRFGLACLGEAEDAFATACERALAHWPRQGVPAEPAAWLHQVARRALVDVLRQRRFEQPLEDGDETDGAPEPPLATLVAPARAERFAAELDDDELALVFAACHPALPPLTQVALALRALSNLPLGAIAEVLLCSEAALAQRLARAREALANAQLEIPSGAELPARREAVLTTLWLAFHLGQRAHVADAAHSGAPPQACWEAIRLARALAAQPLAAHPDADALAAQLLCHGARLTGRWGPEGEIVPLAGQPRDRWDAGMLRLGFAHLKRAQAAERLSRWHVLAGIAAEHAMAPSYEATDWPAILRYYELLLKLDTSAAPRLGHAIALAEAGDAAQARERLLPLLGPRAAPGLRAHVLAALARTHEREGDVAAAASLLEQAAGCARSVADAADLRRRAQALTPTLSRERERE